MLNYIIRNKKKLTKKQSRIVGQLLILSALSGMIVAGLQSATIMIISAGALAIYMFIIPIEHSLEALLFTMSFINIFKISYSSSSFFTFMQIIPVIKILFTKESLNIQKKSLIALGVYTLYIVAFLYTGLGQVTKIFLGFLLLICVYQSKAQDRLNCKNLFFFYSCGIIISSFYSLLFPSIVKTYVSSLVVRLEDESAVGRFSGLFSNPNYFSIEISLALAGNLVLFMNNEESKKELFFIGIPLIVLGIMSQSNGFIFSVVIMLLFIVSFYFRKKAGKAMIIIGLFLILILIFSKQTSTILNRYFFRLTSLESEESSLIQLTNGRIDIWRMYLERILNDLRILLLGNGIETTLNRGAHNAFIEILFCMGIIGSSIYVFLLLSILEKSSPVYRKYTLFSIILFMRAFTANIAFYNNTYFYFLLLFALRCVTNSHNSEQNFTEENKIYGRYLRV